MKKLEVAEAKTVKKGKGKEEEEISEPKKISGVKLLRSEMLNQSMLPTDLLEHIETFDKYLSIEYFDTKMLMNTAHFFGLVPMTGLNTVNNLSSKILRREINIHGDFKKLTQPILKRQLRLYF